MTAVAAPLLAPDPAVPARDALLDAAAAGPRIAAALGCPGAVETCRVLRVKYRRGTRLRVLYDIAGPFGRRLVAASTFPTATRRERALALALAGAAVPGPLAAGGLEPETGAVLWAFPNDRKLRTLAAVAGGALRLPGIAVDAVEPVVWAPEKSATLRLVAGGAPVAYAKVHGEGAADRLAALHRALAAALPPADRDLALPRLLVARHDLDAVAIGAAAGTPLADLAPDRRAAGTARFGAALARLHRLPPPRAERFRRLAPHALPAAAAIVAEARPDVAAEASALARRLAAAAPAPAPLVVVHGDVHPKNALLAGGRVTLIDLDQAGLAPAAADLGSALAGFAAERTGGGLDAAAAAALEDALLAGYAEVADLPPEPALRWHTAAALLAERAVRAVTRLRRPALERLPALLAAADEVAP